ncbi:MAG: type II toxin-antitoxin system VapC family toxin [Chloroflexota bacterium]|nr:type II toxin-antitoxin system VapC family toxin [Chloroflexota bacterium]
MSVVDASIVVRALLRLPIADAATEYIFDPEQRQVAPDLVNSEVLQALRGLERRGAIDASASAAAVETLMLLPIARYPTAMLVHRAWVLRDNFTAYDATYVALAEAVGTRLVTADERLAKAVRAHTAVEVALLA